MASIWMLSKNAMRGMSVVGTISDFLDTLQRERVPSSEVNDRMLHVLDKLILGARSFIDSNIRIESFFKSTAEAVYTDMSLTPTEFVSVLEKCMERIKTHEYQDECLEIIRSIARNAMQVASRRVDTRSLILR